MKILTLIISVLLGVTFSSSVSAQTIVIPIKSVTKSDLINQILADSEWVYNEHTNELKLCFYFSTGNGACTEVPKQYIIIKVIDKPSI